MHDVHAAGTLSYCRFLICIIQAAYYCRKSNKNYYKPDVVFLFLDWCSDAIVSVFKTKKCCLSIISNVLAFAKRNFDQNDVGLLVLSADCNAIIIVAFLENATIEYSSESLCVRIRVCVCVCVCVLAR